MSSSLRVNTIVPSTGTNVAIGTANGTVTFTDSVNFVLGTGSSIFSPASNTLTFGTNDAERLRITSDGKIGIGENNPSTSLHVAGSLTLEEASATGNAWTYYKNSDRTYLVGIRGSSNDALSFYDLTTDVERLRITSDGKVGINETAPDRTLHVNSGATDTALKLESTDAEVSLELTDNTGSSYIGGGGNYLNFYSGAAERLRLTSAGNMGLGTNSPNNYNNYTTLTINGASGGELDFESGGTLLADAFANSGGYYFTTRTAIPIRFHTTNSGGTHAERLQITANGLIGINHASASQIGKVLTIRPANDDGIQLIRPGNTSSSPSVHLDLTTTTSGSVYPSGEAYTVKYNTYNCDQIFETYEGGGTGGHIVFKTAPQGGTPSDRMVLDENGYVTKPNTPAFFVYKATSAWTLAANDVFVFDTAEFNIGSHYNTSNGRFTAPTTARYVFHFFSIYTGNANGDSIEMYKNSTRMNGGDVHFTNTVGGNWDCVHYSRVIQLSAGDYVHMQTRTGHTFHGNHWGGWSGYMLG